MQCESVPFSFLEVHWAVNVCSVVAMWVFDQDEFDCETTLLEKGEAFEGHSPFTAVV